MTGKLPNANAAWVFADTGLPTPVFYRFMQEFVDAGGITPPISPNDLATLIATARAPNATLDSLRRGLAEAMSWVSTAQTQAGALDALRRRLRDVEGWVFSERGRSGVGSGSSTTGSTAYVPVTLGTEPPTLVTDGAGHLIEAPYSPP